ncbi:MauE/DoxX family redox-associated membrane protein [Desulfovibrio ferrophilus]|uniref:DoxX family protein, related to thiosulfate:quinone oxidoreductase n=1 Tax=Desulfovibrio ferrophilus TaxID=241368 RepID=A0A2Z6AVR7_9BACT|nr:MauE/DoxX family redox-associated membrane protein [Desulfovibrio ferrophilus]BBD07349.1 DoxX family protein, related to thiosulfate:quinone oxidoreductase [Desulfovibrio ferrophilus]
MSLVRKLLTHRYLAFAFRLYLGGLFIYASVYKIQYPAEFAEVIAGYQVVPFWLVNTMAVFMPWIELVTGLLLVAGVRSKSAILAIGVMLIMFTLALGYVIIAEIPIGCGCFTSLEDEVSWKTVVRDLTWLAMAVHVFFFDNVFHLENRYSWKVEEL